MKQKIILNSIAVLIALGLVASFFATLFYGLFMKAAGSPDCDMQANSAIVCNTDTYKNDFIMWCFITIALGTVAVLFTRLQLKRLKNK